MEHIKLQFQQEVNQLYNERVKVPCLLGIILVPLFGFLDLVIFPEQFSTFMLLRFATSLLIGLLLYLTYKEFGKKYSGFIAFSFYLVVGVMISIMIRYTGGYESPYYAGLSLLILTIVVLPWTMNAAIGTVSTIYSTYILPIVLFDIPSNNLPIFVNNNFFLLSSS